MPQSALIAYRVQTSLLIPNTVTLSIASRGTVERKQDDKMGVSNGTRPGPFFMGYTFSSWNILHFFLFHCRRPSKSPYLQSLNPSQSTPTMPHKRESPPFMTEAYQVRRKTLSPACGDEQEVCPASYVSRPASVLRPIATYEESLLIAQLPLASA